MLHLADFIRALDVRRGSSAIRDTLTRFRWRGELLVLLLLLLMLVLLLQGHVAGSLDISSQTQGDYKNLRCEVPSSFFISHCHNFSSPLHSSSPEVFRLKHRHLLPRHLPNNFFPNPPPLADRQDGSSSKAHSHPTLPLNATDLPQASIKNDSEVKGQITNIKKGERAPARRSSIVPGMEHISLEAPGEDEFSTSVYGSRFAAEDLPSHEMPEREMPKEIAYRMIKEYVHAPIKSTPSNSLLASSPLTATLCSTSPPSSRPTWRKKPKNL